MADYYKIPVGGNYPPLAGQTPQWWNTGGADYLVQYDMTESDKERRFRDQRWTGAFKKSFGTGTTPEVDFRALSFNQGGNKYLYLSWHIRVHPTTTGGYTSTFVDVGFRPTPAAAKAVRYRITIPSTLTSTTEDGSPAFSAAMYTHNSGASWTQAAAANIPAWLTDDTRVWLQGGTPKWWAVHMRVPLSSVDLSGLFGLGFHIELRTTGPNSTGVDYLYPTGLSADPVFSDPTKYQLSLLGISAAPAAGSGFDEIKAGISLAEADIGTNGVTLHVENPDGTYKTNPDGSYVYSTSPQYIKIYGTTTFFAKPKNGMTTSVDADTLTARFALANWGSASATSQWRTIGDNGTHAIIAANGTQEINLNWTPSAAESNFYKAHRHQCMMVSLSSSDTSLVFLNDSAARNMDFGYASKFAREAEISVQGLSDGFALPQRDVYIYVERTLMPNPIDRRTLLKYEKVRETLRSLNTLEGEWSQEQRFVSILMGDLRHLRFIDIDAAIDWVRENIDSKQLVIDDSVFDALQQSGVEADSLMGLLERYSDFVRRWMRGGLDYDENGQPMLNDTIRKVIGLLVENLSYQGDVPAASHPLPPIEELETYMPAVRYFVYHDTGRRILVDGVVRPILESQDSFGFYMWFDHDVQSWELRLQGAEKLEDDLYLVRPPTDGVVTVTTMIHAVQEGEDVDAPERIVPMPKYTMPDVPPIITDPDLPGCPAALMAVLKSLMQFIQVLLKPLNRP